MITIRLKPSPKLNRRLLKTHYIVIVTFVPHTKGLHQAEGEIGRGVRRWGESPVIKGLAENS